MVGQEVKHLGQELGIGQELGRNWAGTGQELGRNWAGIGQELGRNWAGVGKPAGRSYGRGAPKHMVMQMLQMLNHAHV
jgi:hypothetical protein